MSIKVLVADDHEVVRTGLSSLFDGSDIEIISEASSGGEAVEETLKHRPDVVLLDLHLPGKDGMTVLAELRDDDNLQGLPVVVLTAADDDDIRHRCEHFLRVDSFIRKPVNLDKFLQVIRELKRFWLEDVILPAVE